MDEGTKLLADMLINIGAMLLEVNTATNLHMKGQHEKAEDFEKAIMWSAERADDACRDLCAFYVLTKEMRG